MLKIENLVASKTEMEKTLKEKQEKWIKNDTIFKQRRIVLNYIIRLNLEMFYDYNIIQTIKDHENQRHNFNQKAYDLIYYMIQHIYEKNRLPSIQFMTDIENYLQSQNEEVTQLNKTQSELATKVRAIEEESRDMRKHIEEMRALCDLKEKKDSLQLEIGAQEIRIAQLKK